MFVDTAGHHQFPIFISEVSIGVFMVVAKQRTISEEKLSWSRNETSPKPVLKMETQKGWSRPVGSLDQTLNFG